MVPPPIRGVQFSYPLHYAASWTFMKYAPYEHQTQSLVLGLATKTSKFILCYYAMPENQWKYITWFNYTMIDAYLSDNKTRVRLLGWKDRETKNELMTYLDLQFVNKEDCRAFRWEYLDCASSWSDSTLRRQEMVQIFRKVPDNHGSNNLVNEIQFPHTPCHHPTSRTYQPELARFGSEPAKYSESTSEIYDLFHGQTQCSQTTKKTQSLNVHHDRKSHVPTRTVIDLTETPDEPFISAQETGRSKHVATEVGLRQNLDLPYIAPWGHMGAGEYTQCAIKPEPQVKSMMEKPCSHGPRVYEDADTSARKIGPFIDTSSSQNDANEERPNTRTGSGTRSKTNGDAIMMGPPPKPAMGAKNVFKPNPGTASHHSSMPTQSTKRKRHPVWQEDVRPGTASKKPRLEPPTMNMTNVFTPDLGTASQNNSMYSQGTKRKRSPLAQGEVRPGTAPKKPRLGPSNFIEDDTESIEFLARTPIYMSTRAGQSPQDKPNIPVPTNHTSGDEGTGDQGALQSHAFEEIEDKNATEQGLGNNPPITESTIPEIAAATNSRLDTPVPTITEPVTDLDLQTDAAHIKTASEVRRVTRAPLFSSPGLTMEVVPATLPVIQAEVDSLSQPVLTAGICSINSSTQTEPSDHAFIAFLQAHIVRLAGSERRLTEEVAALHGTQIDLMGRGD